MVIGDYSSVVSSYSRESFVSEKCVKSFEICYRIIILSLSIGCLLYKHLEMSRVSKMLWMVD